MAELEISFPLHSVEADDGEGYFMAGEVKIPFPLDLRNYVIFVFTQGAEEPRLVLRPRRSK